MPPALTDYTFAFGETGFVLNTDNVNTFPFVDITDVAGLDNAPIRVNTDEHEGMDGTYVDANFMSSRTIVLTGNLYDPLTADDTCDLLKSQYGPGPIQPFYFQLPGKPMRFINARGGGAKYDLDTNRSIGLTPIQLTLLAGDPYIYDYALQSDTCSLAPAILNANWDFETGVAPWTIGNSATLSQSNLWSYTGSFSALFTGNGSTANPQINSEKTIAVVPGQTYLGSAYLYSPQGFSSTGVQCNILWWTSGSVFISSSGGSVVALPAGAPGGTLYSVSAVAPPTAAFGQLQINVSGTPANTVQFFVDNAQLNPGPLGLGFNVKFNVGFGGTSIAPTCSVVNSGNHTAYPLLTLSGPLTNPVIVDSLNGITMGPLALTLQSSDSLVIDCRYKTMTLNGAVSRRSSYMGLQFPSVPAGLSDTFALSADSGTGTLTAAIRNTYF